MLFRWLRQTNLHYILNIKAMYYYFDSKKINHKQINFSDSEQKIHYKL